MTTEKKPVVLFLVQYIKLKFWNKIKTGKQLAEKLNVFVRTLPKNSFF